MSYSTNMLLRCRSISASDAALAWTEMEMQGIRSTITANGFVSTELTDWRGIGFEFVCERNGLKAIIILAHLEDDLLMLQVGHSYIPGLIMSLLGKKKSSNPSEIFEVSKIVEGWYSERNDIESKHWAWNRMPDPKIDQITPTTFEHSGKAK